MNRLQPVLLSGGSGTRLWPASREHYPKQFLPLTGERSLLQQTATRLAGKPNLAGKPIVVCNEAHRFLVAEQLRAVGLDATILLEPEGRNTAPAVALAALLTLRSKGDGSPLLLVMPADHVIRDRGAFMSAVESGEAAAEEGKLVTFGVLPSHPHTGYGYIETDAADVIARPIKSFVEKPDKQNAVRLLETNRFFWNAGIFLFRAEIYIEELEKFVPEIVAACRKAIKSADVGEDFIRPDAEAFKAGPADSIDYAVMEKTDRAVMVPLAAGWSDVGSWSAVHEASEKDEQGNVLHGDVLALECKDSYINAGSRLVAGVGLENIVVVEDKDSVLVVPKDRAQDVKALVEALRRGNREETKLHRQVVKPWGSYDSVDGGDGFQVKRLIVNPGAQLSLQKHARRAEHWVVVRGRARVTRDDEVFELGVNESTHIPAGAVHRIANPGDEPLHIIEVQCGDYLGEDDIVRLDDNYGREGTTT